MPLSRNRPSVITDIPNKPIILYRPVRLMIWPPTMLAVIMTIIMGIITVPLWVAVVPITPWMNSGMNRIVPNIPMAISISASVLALMLMAIGMFGTILFIPLFIQGVIGTTATQSGTVMMPMMIVMITASIVGGQIISRTGRYKMIGLFGMSVMTLGLFLLSGMGPDTDYLTVVRNMVIVGLGMGPTMPVFTLAAQNAVQMSQLGVVTSLTQFARSIG